MPAEQEMVWQVANQGATTQVWVAEWEGVSIVTKHYQWDRSIVLKGRVLPEKNSQWQSYQEQEEPHRIIILESLFALLQLLLSVFPIDAE